VTFHQGHDEWLPQQRLAAEVRGAEDRRAKEADISLTGLQAGDLLDTGALLQGDLDPGMAGPVRLHDLGNNP
jgi:hypothetical protein